MPAGLGFRQGQLYKPRYILIEEASTGPALAGEIKPAEVGIIQLVRPTQDKQLPLFTQQKEFAAGRIWFPKRAPWLRVFTDELLGFPECRYSDQVDSMSQALAFRPSFDLGAADIFASLTDSYMFRYAMARGW